MLITVLTFCEAPHCRRHSVPVVRSGGYTGAQKFVNVFNPSCSLPLSWQLIYTKNITINARLLNKQTLSFCTNFDVMFIFHSTRENDLSKSPLISGFLLWPSTSQRSSTFEHGIPCINQPKLFHSNSSYIIPSINRVGTILFIEEFSHKNATVSLSENYFPYRKIMIGKAHPKKLHTAYQIIPSKHWVMRRGKTLQIF